MAGGDERVLLGEIVAAHGIRGLVKVRSYTDRPEDVAAYGPLSDQDGSALELSARGTTRGGILAAVSGVTDRTAAEALCGRRLYVARAQLPPIEAQDEYYHADLVGLEARSRDGHRLGLVEAVQDFGAGDMLEIRLDGEARTVLVPFTAAFVPEVAPEAGYLAIAPQPGLLD